MVGFEIVGINSIGVKHTAILGTQILTEIYDVNILRPCRVNHRLGRIAPEIAKFSH